MRVEFHKLVASDISRIMDYYEDVAGAQLADEFYEELRALFQTAAESPESYAIRERDLLCGPLCDLCAPCGKNYLEKIHHRDTEFPQRSTEI